MESVKRNYDKLTSFSSSNNKNSSSNNEITFFTCEICIEPVPLNQKFKNMEMKGCTHPYCTECVAKYIEAKVIQDNASDIKCPNTDCNVMLDALSCHSILPKTVFEKWCHVLCESAVLQESSKGGFAEGRSYCPFRDCFELVLDECVRNTSTTTRVTRSECPNCKKLFCFDCRVPWNENHKCIKKGKMISDVNKSDVLFLKKVKHNRLTRCPTCNHYVQLRSGCRYIRCRYFLSLSLLFSYFTISNSHFKNLLLKITFYNSSNLKKIDTFMINHILKTSIPGDALSLDV